MALDLPVLLFAAALTLGTGLLFGLFPALHSTRPNLLSALKGQSGQPSGARDGGPLPDGPGGGADRALDGAARGGGPVHEEPVQRRPRRPRPRRRQRRHLRRLAGIERLHPGAVAAAVRAAGGGAWRRCRASAARPASMVPLLAGSNWNSGVWVEGFRGRPRHEQRREFQQGGAGLLPHARHPAARRPGVHAERRRRTRRTSRSSTKRSPRSSTWAGTRSGSGWDRARTARRWTSRSSGWCRTRSTAR